MAYVTAAQFKSFTKITEIDATRDTFIDVLIARAEKIVNKYCNVATFENSATTTNFIEQWLYKDWLYLPVVQCETITSIILYEQDSDNAADATFTSDQWFLEKEKSRLWNLYGDIKNLQIRVIYTPNNGGVPVDIVEATLEIALRMWNDSNYGRAMFDVTSKDIIDESIQIFNTTPLPRNAKLILDQYKRVVL